MKRIILALVWLLPGLAFSQTYDPATLQVADAMLTVTDTGGRKHTIPLSRVEYVCANDTEGHVNSILTITDPAMLLDEGSGRPLLNLFPNFTPVFTNVKGDDCRFNPARLHSIKERQSGEAVVDFLDGSSQVVSGGPTIATDVTERLKEVSGEPLAMRVRGRETLGHANLNDALIGSAAGDSIYVFGQHAGNFNVPAGVGLYTFGARLIGSVTLGAQSRMVGGTVVTDGLGGVGITVNGDDAIIQSVVVIGSALTDIGISVDSGSANVLQCGAFNLLAAGLRVTGSAEVNAVGFLAKMGGQAAVSLASTGKSYLSNFVLADGGQVGYGVSMESTGEYTLISPRIGNAAQVGVHMGAGTDGARVKMVGGSLGGAQYDFMHDFAATGVGTFLSVSGLHLRSERALFMPWWLVSATTMVQYADEGVNSDPGFVYIGDVQVGASTKGSSLSVGRGHSTGLGMQVRVEGGTGFSNETDAASSRSRP